MLVALVAFFGVFLRFCTVHLRDTHITPPTHHCISVSAAVPMALFVALFFFVLLSGSFGMNLTCSLEDCPPPTTEPLFITDAAHLCTMSDLYGQELTEEFVSRVAEVGDTHGGPKLRTQATADGHGSG